MSTVLVDGSNIFSIQYAANSTMDSNGVPVGGASGMLKFLAKLCSTLKPSRMVVFFDGDGGSAKRKSIYKEYKGGRSPRRIIGRKIGFADDKSAIENKDFQFNSLLDILETLPVNVIVTDGYEADDGIAHFVKFRNYFGCADEEMIYIVSSDKDFGQLISKDVWIYHPIYKAFINEDNFVEKYEVNQKNWLFFRAICGDESDNLPGVRGIGLKTLSKVISVKENLSFTIEDVEKVAKENKVAAKIIESKEIIERNWKLMNLSEPLISNNSITKLDNQIKNHKPALNKIEFMLKSSRLNFVDISTCASFHSLLTRK